MMYLLGIIVLLLGLVVSVALHEMGHLLPAKKFGAMVPEYWIGFGPELYSRTIRGTVYGIKAVLLGGFVRIVGMFPPANVVGKSDVVDQAPVLDSATGAATGTRMTMVQQAREQSAEEIAEARADGLKGRAFYELSTPKKLVVMLGGPVMNLLLAVVLTLIVVMGFGWRETTTTIDSLAADPTTGVQLADSPAAVAGLQPGDVVTAWGGVPVDSWAQLRELMADSGTSPTEITVMRDGAPLSLEVTPQEGEDGVPRVGIVAQQVRVRGSVGDAGSQVWQQLYGTGAAIVRLPVSLWQLGTSFVTGEERDPAGVVSVVGVARVAGEVSSLGESNGVSFADRAAMMLSLLAALNIALFVFNLIPLPPLDGGHVAGALWGGARNTWARMRGKPRPRPVDTARMVPVSYVMFLILMVMTVVLVAADLFKPLSLT